MYITESKIEEYCQKHTSYPHPSLEALVQVTQNQLPHAARMQVGPLEGQFLKMIAQISGAQNVLEFGTFTGYSSTCFALAVGPQGRVTTLDRDPGAAELAQSAWIAAGVESRVELIIGPALDSAKKLLNEVNLGNRPCFDLVFIDADKANYQNYFELALKLVRSRGLVLVDNVLWSGEVLDPQDSQAKTIASFNDWVNGIPGVERVMLPLRDGITLVQKLN